jgi:uncharacterized protein (DUF433 family)
MKKEYVKKVEGAYRVGETRVSLDSLVFLFREGMSAESMVDSHPALTLEQVHGALAFYLANQKEIDAYLSKSRRGCVMRQVDELVLVRGRELKRDQNAWQQAPDWPHLASVSASLGVERPAGTESHIANAKSFNVVM